MLCRIKRWVSIILIVICISAYNRSLAQENHKGLGDLQIFKTTQNKNIVTHVLKITNNSDQQQQGVINLDSPEEISSLSAHEKKYNIAPGDSSFISFKLVINQYAKAGIKSIKYTKIDQNGRFLESVKTTLEIQKREQLNLIAISAPIVITIPNDSIRVNVYVKNGGNNDENVKLVFNVPGLQGAPQFVEISGIVKAMEQKSFVYSFYQSRNLAATDQYQVYITGMKGDNKTVFEFKTVNIRNISSIRSYVDPMSYDAYKSEDNALSLSYRMYNGMFNTMQIRGGGYIDLPQGYLHLKGNVYKYDGSTTPQITNTELTYKLMENEFSVGNVSEMMEVPVYGRGAKATFTSNDKNKSIIFGVVDQNFNLVSPEPMFSDYYSFYIKGDLGAMNYKKGLEGSFLFQKNPYEKSDNSVAGMIWRTTIGNDWKIGIKTYAAFSDYVALNKEKYTGMAEATYQGVIGRDLNVNGSAFYSSGYFPGSRRGATSFYQGAIKSIADKIFLSGSYSYNKSEPKSFVYEYTYQSENNYGSIGLSLPKVLNISPSLQYLYQYESSNSYSMMGFGTPNGNLSMNANRLSLQFRWQSMNVKHSVYGSVQAGMYKNVYDDQWENQRKYSLNYSFNGFTLSSSYQNGAFYIYEQLKTNINRGQFERTALGGSYNKMIGKKVSFSSSLNFSNDSFQGNMYTANSAVKFNSGEQWSFYVNGYWSQYRYLSATRDNWNMEVGITHYFNKTLPSSKRKSKLIAQVYYDKNLNNQFDKEDEPVSDYLVDVADKVFITNKDGEARYNHVPYGEYTIKPLSAGKWFFKAKDITVNKSKTKINIPLIQNGIIQGKIYYTYDKSSLKTELRYSGIRLFITNKESEIIQTVITDNNGHFSTFVPEGDYHLILDKSTLMENTECLDYNRKITIKSEDKIITEDFEVKVKGRHIYMKRFTASY
ncbi:MAG: hypothetical protein VB024_03885 [Dysgonamonadaceae bacterium]|nr:hypothetical protein [Dysgonamonadaceae bacterium]